MCGKKTGDLQTLMDRYKTEHVQHVCDKCLKIVNDHIWKIRSVTDGMLKTAIKRFMDNKNQAIEGK